MKVSVLTVLHYGLDFLPFALKSVYDFADEIQVVYSPHPSHGHRAGEPCPERGDDLKAAALDVGPKVKWSEVNAFWREGDHRDHALSLCGGDLVLTVDADEVWDPAVLDGALKQAWDGSAEVWRLRFTTPWRSFSFVCKDDMLPERIRDRRPGRGAKYGCVNKDLGPIWHFGYAISTSLLRYKMQCHGHKDEWRANWLEEKWTPWPPVRDVHPTCVGFWNPEPMDPNVLPAIMRAHPFWGVAPVP